MEPRNSYSAPRGYRPPPTPVVVERARPNAYLESAVLSAPREQLLLMLFDGALRFIESGKARLEARQYLDAEKGFLSARNIVTELMQSQQPSIGEAYGRLMALYRFALERLARAGLEKSAALADEAAKVLSDLRATWAEAIAASKNAPI
ncbi:flagellar export chaperone FliS [bacterium]|nr:MAG: flagellar export chaperone FliS [bacterium]RIK61740.1 MAG: flagellar export chaperone FliS [Planctomycetota bacterium]